MKRFFSLVKINLKTASDDFSQNLNFKKSDTKLKLIGKKLLVGFLIIYLLGIIAIPSNYLIDSFIKINQTNLLIHLLFLITPVVTLYFSILSTPGVFYFSKDIQNYLTMPFRSWEIIGAKFVTAYIHSLIGLGFKILPAIVIFIIKVQPDILFILLTFLSLLIVPIIPLAVSILIVVILMRFVPFFKNKDLFMYLTFGLVFIPIFFIGISSGATSSDPKKIEGLMNAIMNMDNTAYQYFDLFFPTSKYLSQGIIQTRLLPILAIFVISLTTLFVILYITESFYFEGVLSITESSSKKKRLNRTKRDAYLTNDSKIINFLKIDIKNILRTPAFVINYFSPIFIIPIVGIVPILITDMPDNLGNIINEASYHFHELFYAVSTIDHIQIALSIGFALGFLISNFEASSNTAISREGKQMKRFLSMPLSLTDLIKAKALLSILISSFLPLLIIIAATIILKPRIITVIMFGIGTILGILVVVLTGILVDVYSPSLSWDTEQQAIKGNFKQVLVVLPFMFVPVLLILIATTFESWITLMLVSIGSILLITLLYRQIMKLAKTKLVETVQNLES